eukprot:COSAG01_NODE_324_length_18846_cov_60.042193_13_plen_551_part_00
MCSCASLSYSSCRPARRAGGQQAGAGAAEVRRLRSLATPAPHQHRNMYTLGLIVVALVAAPLIRGAEASPLSPHTPPIGGDHHDHNRHHSSMMVADDAFARAVMPKGPITPKAAASKPKCFDRSDTAVQEGQECGNGAVCPVGFRCTRSMSSHPVPILTGHPSNKTFQSSGLFGLKDLCEPESCDAEATRGGPHNMTCFEQRRDGSLICGESAAGNTPAHAMDLCDTLRLLLPSGCVVDNGCFAFECGVTLLGVGLNFGAELDVCGTPARAQIFVDTIPASGTGGFVRSITAGVRVFIPIPFISFSIPGIGGAGGYMLGDIEGSLAMLNLQLAVDACAIVLGFEVCGSSLTSSLPFNFLDTSINFVGPCGGGPTPPPPTPPPGPPICDTGYQCSPGFEVCGRFGDSCCTAEFAVACLTAAVPSGSCCRGDFPVCSQPGTCTRTAGLTTPCAGGGACPDSTVCNTGGCCPFDFPVFCMTNTVPRTEQVCCSGDFPICVVGGCMAGNGAFHPGVTPTAKVAIEPEWVRPKVSIHMTGADSLQSRESEPSLVL